MEIRLPLAVGAVMMFGFGGFAGTPGAGEVRADCAQQDGVRQTSVQGVRVHQAAENPRTEQGGRRTNRCVADGDEETTVSAAAPVPEAAWGPPVLPAPDEPLADDAAPLPDVDRSAERPVEDPPADVADDERDERDEDELTEPPTEDTPVPDPADEETVEEETVEEEIGELPVEDGPEGTEQDPLGEDVTDVTPDAELPEDVAADIDPDGVEGGLVDGPLPEAGVTPPATTDALPVPTTDVGTDLEGLDPSAAQPPGEPSATPPSGADVASTLPDSTDQETITGTTNTLEATHVRATTLATR